MTRAEWWYPGPGEYIEGPHLMRRCGACERPMVVGRAEAFDLLGNKTILALHASGRPKRFCSAACRQRAHRAKGKEGPSMTGR